MVLTTLKQMRRVWKRTRYRFNVLRRVTMESDAKQCPLCGQESPFFAFGMPPRFNAQCPKCFSLERHRLFNLVDQEHGLLRATDDVIHFAPEKPLRNYITSRTKSYTTSNYPETEADADLCLNIEAIDLADGSYDVVIASHILEHVDDEKALAEIFRILKPGGRFIGLIPIVEGWDQTYENADIKTPHGRELHFGQNDHVRLYGRDFRERVKEAGFELHEYVQPGDKTVRHGLIRGDKIFYCVKPE